MKGVTIVTSTIRSAYKQAIFDNYARQKWPAKELIIILNKYSLPMADYLRIAKRYRQVRVFRLPDSKSLGECLNFGASKARYEVIAKFDDDDYYAPHYLPEAMHMLKNPQADLVGKASLFFYFPSRKKLLLINRSQRPFRRVGHIGGATIVFRKKVLSRVKFARLAEGTDLRFLQVCMKQGYRLFTTSPYNFAAIRRPNLSSHTWKIKDQELLSKPDSQIISVKDYQSYVNRPLSRLIRG